MGYFYVIIKNNKNIQVIKNCLKCNKEFKTRLSQIKKGWGKYCSHKCANKGKFVKGHKINLGRKFPRKRRKPLSSITKEKIRNKALGRIFSEEHKRKLGLKSLGRKHSEDYKRKYSGKNSSNWRGGISKVKTEAGVYRQNYRAKKLSNGGSYTVGEWETLKAQYNWICPCCKRKEPEIKLSIDHIIPISRGGSNNIENIQPLCRSCNCRKSNRFMIKYNIDSS